MGDKAFALLEHELSFNLKFLSLFEFFRRLRAVVVELLWDNVTNEFFWHGVAYKLLRRGVVALRLDVG